MNSNENLILIRSIEDLKNLQLISNDFEYVSYDTETTGLEKDAEIVGFSISGEVTTGYYVILASYDKEKNTLNRCSDEFKTLSKELIASLKNKKLIMHNSIFDIEKTISNFGINLLEALHTDTMLLAHLLNENRRVGLKDLCAEIFGESEKKEQEEMGKSVQENGGVYQKKNKEMYKADSSILGRYGAKDTILTLKLFYHFIPQLIEQNLYEFFYEEETMPLLKTATYQMNTTGLKLDIAKMKFLKKELEDEILLLKSEIHKQVFHYVKDYYPGTNEKNSFNINSSNQLSWLLFTVLKNEFVNLTDKGREFAKETIGKVPYTSYEKRSFIETLISLNMKPEKFLKCDKDTLQQFSDKYDWVKKMLQLRKSEKLLSTYVDGILERSQYGVIHPYFLQHGTSGTRMSSRNPNFQNLPRDDKRIKSCIVSRPGKVFVGADYSQLEPRVFTSLAQDEMLMKAFENSEDFYSTVAMPIFGIIDCSANKNDINYLGNKHPKIRQIGKEIALSLAYGTTPFKLSSILKNKANIDLSVKECEDIRNKYFTMFYGVDRFVKNTHSEIIKNGVVYNLFGRPRRIDRAKVISMLDEDSFYGLPYEYRTLLNLSVNSKVQGTAGSIINRASIAFCDAISSIRYDAKIVMQVHDELIVECEENKAEEVKNLLKLCMEESTILPGVKLIAEPKIAKNLGDLK